MSGSTSGRGREIERIGQAGVVLGSALLGLFWLGRWIGDAGAWVGGALGVLAIAGGGLARRGRSRDSAAG